MPAVRVLTACWLRLGKRSQAFSGYSAGGAKRSSKGAAKTRRMCRECPAESTPAMRARPLIRSSARPLVRSSARPPSARRVPRRHAGRVAPAQPAACAGK
ncbi:hypothetical protein VP95_09710 [Burkholderia pseudomallei]|nr:hypothetical protein VP95_09710 [Burkholderia pseudomallei]